MKIFQAPIAIFSSIKAIITRASYFSKATFVEQISLSLFRTEAKNNVGYKTLPHFFSAIETET